MKKIVLIATAILSIFCVKAQSLADMPQPVRVYGIDFSKVKICGADESSYQFAGAFQGINMLLLSESKKYDFERFLHHPIASIDLEPVQQKNATGNYISQFDKEVMITETDLRMLIDEYELEATEGTGVVLVALLLDKTQSGAIYDVVFFDIATRELLAVHRMSGKAGGFGLRNYWARSVYEVLKSPIGKKITK